MSANISHLIINSPYESPKKHWVYNRQKRTFSLVDGRRPPGYFSSSGTTGFDDPGIFNELPLVKRIRQRVEDWKKNDYPGITTVTRNLIRHWNNQNRETRFFFCQLEAIETLIWMNEAHESEKQGIDLPSDGGPFLRICSKMATATGKTIVMGMLIAWQTLNKVSYPSDNRFSKYFLVIAPGITVRRRLEVLQPFSENSIFREFDIIPASSYDLLRRAKIIIHNWHVLMPLEDKKKSVMKRGPEGNESFAQRILGKNNFKNIIVINDEAHHAWRIAADNSEGLGEDQIEEATQWMNGLDKIHASRGIKTCYDFSATPFIPGGKNLSEENLFGWVVSDFSLNDAIESGLVKTPRVAIRDDGRFDREYRSKFYHLYSVDEVRTDLNRKAKPSEALHDLIRNAYFVLGKDWIETRKLWSDKSSQVPPVMITVCNRTETSARVEYSFKNQRFEFEEQNDPLKILHIDSAVLEKAEMKTEEDFDHPTATDQFKSGAEILREKVATVGKVGKIGQHIDNVIAVDMLSEGWDARNVTHIMGLRAFTSQLLCEQVVGRGLRRMSYEVDENTGFFKAEYVNIFGIPFTFIPAEGNDESVPLPPKPTTIIEPDPLKVEHQITWPNVIRIDRTFRPKLEMDWNRVKQLTIRPEDTSFIVDLAPIIDGKPHVDKISTIDIENLGKKFRLQTSIFKISREVYEQLKPDSWKGIKEYLLIQIVEIVERFIKSKIRIPNVLFDEEDRRRILIALNMSKVVHHIWNNIIFQNISTIALVFDREKPLLSTNDMMMWSSARPAEYTTKSHISHAVVDSRWEQAAVGELERNDSVKSWVKNDHLRFDIVYIYQGVVHKYLPDFIIKLKNGLMLILEIKGYDTPKDKTKRQYLDEWVNAINEDGRFGKWTWDVAFAQSDVRSIIRKKSGENYSK